MSNFSSIACYAALKNVSHNNIINAYTRMISALIQQKRYKICDTNTMCKDFLEYYGFELPYHPMHTIIQECIKQKYLTYNSFTHQIFPNYEIIENEEFMQIVEQKDSKYQTILNEFNQYLIDEYQYYASNEELNERVLAFIERYGIKTKTDKKLIHKVKDDYFFASFLVFCEENGRKDILDYFDEYTVGVALSEIFIYCEKPEFYTSKGACVYLDTGIIFRLFGIDAFDRQDSYISFLKNIQHMGMKVKIYEHTLNEIIGIIESTKHWIGNINFDLDKSSEATYYFVRNNWSIDKIDELSSNLQLRLQTEFNISIDYMNYPREEDIATIHEADINEMIIKEYQDSGSRFSIEEKGYSIEQDARSIFFTQHQNGKIVPYHINEVKNIFITTNRSLARVGYKIASSYTTYHSSFIPSVMTDIKWGTMLWFNSPTKISDVNRPRLVSAAYAAFRPSSELTKKINSTLIMLVDEGKITAEQCYLLKVNPAAQRLFAKNTSNDPENLVDSTPFEIMKELGDQAFRQGSLSRQDEIDALNAEKTNTEIMLAKEKHNTKIKDLKHQIAIVEAEINSITSSIDRISNELQELDLTKETIDTDVSKRMKTIRILLSFFAGIFFVGALVITFFWDLLIAIIPFTASAYVFIVSIWKKDSINVFALLSKYEKHYHDQQCELRRYSDARRSALQSEKEELEQQQNKAEVRYFSMSNQLKMEEMETDKYSISLSCFEIE